MAPPYAKPKRWGNLMSCCIRPASPLLLCENDDGVDGKTWDRACLLRHSHTRTETVAEEEEEEAPLPLVSAFDGSRRRCCNKLENRKVRFAPDLAYNNNRNPSDKEKLPQVRSRNELENCRLGFVPGPTNSHDNNPSDKEKKRPQQRSRNELENRNLGFVPDLTDDNHNNPSGKENSAGSLASAAISILVQNREKCALSLLDWDGKMEVENGGSTEEGEECRRSGWFKRLMRKPFMPSKLNSNNGALLLLLKKNDRLPSSSLTSSPRSSNFSSPRSRQISKKERKKKKKAVSNMREIDVVVQDHLHRSVFQGTDQNTNININYSSSSSSEADLHRLYNSTNAAANSTQKTDGRKRAHHYCCFTDPSYALKKKISSSSSLSSSSKRGFSDGEERGSLLLF